MVIFLFFYYYVRMFLFHSMNMDCGVFGGWPYLAYQYVQGVVRNSRYSVPLSHSRSSFPNSRVE